MWSAHVRCTGVSPVADDFGGSVLRDGVEQLVLHFGKEEMCALFVGQVVAAQCKQFSHLLVKPLFGRTDFADARQQFFEVIPAPRVLEAFVVHDETFDQVFGQVGSGPLAELGALH